MKVRLKLRQSNLEKFLFCCFNSMKVRLKPFKPSVLFAHILFQFHEGPIKTFDPVSAGASFLTFQFHEGPIKTTALLRLTLAILVSIP